MDYGQTGNIPADGPTTGVQETCRVCFRLAAYSGVDLLVAHSQWSDGGEEGKVDPGPEGLKERVARGGRKEKKGGERGGTRNKVVSSAAVIIRIIAA
jgi:hypothetical protein